MYKFGDILLGDYKFTDGSDSKIRPVLVLSQEGVNYIVLMITSQDLASGEIVFISQDEENNLKKDSYIKLRNIATSHKELFFRKLGSITSDQKVLVKNSLMKYVGEL